MNLVYIYRNDSDLIDIKSDSPEEHILRVFLLSTTDKVAFKVLRKLIRKEKGSYFLGEFLTFKVKKNKCIITDDWELDLGVEKIEVETDKILELLKSWEAFLLEHNKLLDGK